MPWWLIWVSFPLLFLCHSFSCCGGLRERQLRANPSPVYSWLLPVHAQWHRLYSHWHHATLSQLVGGVLSLLWFGEVCCCLGSSVAVMVSSPKTIGSTSNQPFSWTECWPLKDAAISYIYIPFTSPWLQSNKSHALPALQFLTLLLLCVPFTHSGTWEKMKRILGHSSGKD